MLIFPWIHLTFLTFISFGQAALNVKCNDPRKSTVSLLLNGTSYRCGGVLISSEYILTSGDCVKGFKPKEVIVRSQKYEVRRVRYSADALQIRNIIFLDARVALLRLTKAIRFGQHVQSICLPKNESSPSSMNWGLTWSSKTDELSNFQYFIPIWPKTKCPGAVTGRELCAGFDTLGRIPCLGDAGTPLMSRMPDGQWAVIGLSTANCTQPRIYTAVSPYVKGIVALQRPPVEIIPNTSEICGLNNRNMQRSGRIVGGSLTEEFQWPWMVSLLKIVGSKLSPFCGGVLIDNLHVLTAAHCLKGKSADQLRVRLGEHDFGRATGSERDHRVQLILLHENYNGQTFHNDIALLKLKIAVKKYNETIRPVCLPPPDLGLVERAAHITGWGRVSETGSVSGTLREIIVPVWNQDKCRSAYLKLGWRLFARQFCAGDTRGGRDACQGDSGGPLMLQLASGRWAVLGVVSWGLGCARPNQPGVYTHVSSYLDWIQRRISGHHLSPN